MGVAGQDERKALRFCMTLELTQVKGCVSFQDVMDALVNNNFKSQLKEGIPPPEQSDAVEEVMRKREKAKANAAAKLGMDPIELRRKNLIPPSDLPMKSPMGLDIDCGNFPEVFEKTIEISDRTGFEKRKEASEAKGLKRGFGVCMYLECTGGGPKEEAKVTFRDDGKVELSVGTASTGMGHETVFAQLLSGHLGIAMEDVVFRQSDTDATDIGGGHGGSRGLEVGGSAVTQTSRQIIEVGKKIAAHRFDVDAGEIEFEEGRFHVPGTNHTMTIRDAPPHGRAARGCVLKDLEPPHTLSNLTTASPPTAPAAPASAARSP